MLRFSAFAGCRLLADVKSLRFIGCQIAVNAHFHKMPADGNHWKRPDSVPFPVVWRRFERPDKQTGKVRKFRVQDVDDKGLEEALVKHMSDYFLDDEPTCHALNLKKDAKSLQETEEIWRSLFAQRIVLACVEEKEDGTLVTAEGSKVPLVVGCNFTYVSRKGDKNPKAEGKCLRTICDAMDYLASHTNSYAHYGVEEYLYAFGLSVDPRYRGMGIGTEILKSRNDMGPKMGLKATVTTFTALASQKVAERCGYEVLVEMSYEDIQKHDPRFTFPGIQTKTMKLMGRKLDVALP